MKLMTKELEKQIPALYSQDGKGFNATVYAHYFSLTGWHWYITEYSKEYDRMFGYVVGLEKEWGYVSLEELESLGRIIERDLYFTPKPLKEIIGYDLWED